MGITGYNILTLGFLTSDPGYSEQYSALAEQDDPHSVIDARIVKLINNVGLLNEAKSLHAQLQPVVNALDRLQFDSATLVKNGLVF